MVVFSESAKTQVYPENRDKSKLNNEKEHKNSAQNKKPSLVDDSIESQSPSSSSSSLNRHRRREIEEIVFESATSSTTHAIPHIFKRENLFLKLFWIVCLLGATGVCAWMVSSSIIDYFDYETVSKTETVLEIPTTFPTVSFCNINPFVTNYSLQFVEELFVKNGAAKPDPNLGDTFCENCTSDVLIFYKYFATLNALAPNLTDADRKRMGYNLEDVLISCIYDLIVCDASDFEWYFDPYHGSCYRFNSGRNASGHSIADRKSTRSGKLNGLSVELYVGEPTSLFSLSSSSGIHVIVHNKSVRTFFFDGFDMPAGMVGNVAVSRKFSSLVPSPYSECRDDDYIESSSSELVQAVLRLNYNYKQTDCFGACWQRALINECHCYDLTSNHTFPNMPVPPCLSFSDVNCDGWNFANFYSQDVKSICGDECPLECNKAVYSITTSFVEYPSKSYARILRQNKKIQAFFDGNLTAMTDEALKKSLLQLNVYYAELSYEVYSESQKTSLVDLVSGIGGTLGLFLGMSFLSFVEFIDLIVQICLVLIKSQSKTN